MGTPPPSLGAGEFALWRGQRWSITKVPPPGRRLEPLRQAAAARVDAEAERARLGFITGGAGQALEYDATRREAEAATAASDPLDAKDWPMLEAERRALADSGAANPSLRDVVAEIAAQLAAWTAAGAEIKRLRRTAKLKIERAATPEAIARAATIGWPKP